MEEPQCETKPTRLGRRLNGKCSVDMKTAHITAPSSAPGGYGCQTLAPLLADAGRGKRQTGASGKADELDKSHRCISRSARAPPSIEKAENSRERHLVSVLIFIFTGTCVHVHLHSRVNSHTHIKKKRNSTFVLSQFRLSPPIDTVYD